MRPTLKARAAGETPGSESNVKEIYDKVRELLAEPANRVLNQFEELGNYRFHFHCTAHAAQEVVDSLGLDAAASVSAMGSAGTCRRAGRPRRPRLPAADAADGREPGRPPALRHRP